MDDERMRESTLQLIKNCRNNITKIFSDLEGNRHNIGELSLLPYCRCRIARFIKMLEIDGKLYPEFHREYDQISALIEILTQKFGSLYYDALYDELEERMNRFSSLVLNKYIDFEDDPVESSNDLASRELIELALIELEKQNYDLREIKLRIYTVDEKLKELYWEGRDFIIEKGIMNYFERPYYPDRFWFYHPLKLFEEMERERKQTKESTH